MHSFLSNIQRPEHAARLQPQKTWRSPCVLLTWLHFVQCLDSWKPQRKVEMSNIILDSSYKLLLLLRMRRIYVMHFCFCSRQPKPPSVPPSKGSFFYARVKMYLQMSGAADFPAVKKEFMAALWKIRATSCFCVPHFLFLSAARLWALNGVLTHNLARIAFTLSLSV